MELRNCNPHMRNGLQDECNYRSYYRGSLQGRTNYRQNFNQRQVCIDNMSNWRRDDDEWPDSEQGSCFEGICGGWTDTEDFKPEESRPGGGRPGDGKPGGGRPGNGRPGDGNKCPECPTYPTREPGIDIGVGTSPEIPVSQPTITVDPVEPPITRPPPSSPPPPSPPPSSPPPSSLPPSSLPITTTPTPGYTEPEGCEPIMLPYSSSIFPMGLYGPKFALCPYVALTECAGSLVTFRC